MKSVATKLLISIGLPAVLFSFFIFYHTYSLTNKRVTEVVEHQASMALKFDLAIRKYVGNNIRPLMYKLVGEDDFVPETMSTSYVARTIFEDVRSEFPDYIIKFSSDNPRNPSNQAGPEELKVIEYLNNNPHLKRWQGIISINGRQYMGNFSARRMKESCLRCHGDPKDAPASLIEKYGSTAGFHRPIGEIIGLDTVAIPMTKVSQKLWLESINTFVFSGIGLILFLLAITLAFKLLIINRLSIITQHFETVASQTDYSQIEPIKIKGSDEIKTLASSFNTLTNKLRKSYSSLDMQVKERTRELEGKNEQLKQEIDERRRAEKALRESETRFKELFKNIHSGVAVYEAAENGADFVFKDFNRTAEKIEGITKEELIGKSVLKVFPEVRDLGLFDVFQKVWKSGRPEHYPVSLYQDGSITGWRENFVYKLPTGEIVTVYTDETEHKQAEEERRKLEIQLQQVQKMESIGTLAGGIAHDFNNILGIIVGNTELAMDDVPEWNPARNNLEEIRTASLRARDVVKQILAFSRRSPQEMKPVRISPIIKESLKLLRSSIPKTIEIHQEISSNSDTVRADPTQLNQILINLCANAAHAMRDKGGVLEVGMENVKLDEETANHFHDLLPGEYVKLTVSDTGHGMEPKVLKRIFDPYFTTKKVGEGSGMGLSVVHGIVKTHGGDILVDSKLGVGTTIQVFFPYTESDPQPKIEIPVEIPRGLERILFVDDEKAMVDAIQSMIKRLGYEVTARTSSIEALEAFRANPDRFDLVITDFTMPNMTGMELAKKLLKLRSDVPIILCTGYSDQINEDKAKGNGIRAFVMKPVVLSEIASIIRKVLDKEIE
jgi:two-component system cell cycle sensor histidine kinase/response regulator CckA